ncbi:MAG: GNAT family N-acetyltransferase [Acutalibacteraceae bacterium]|jgi:GNAT superfamily N-acetyltransferase
MIRLAKRGEELPFSLQTEASVKLAGWHAAYGDDERIVRFWITEHGGTLGQMGDTLLADLPGKDHEEAAAFAAMQPVTRLRSDPAFVRAVSALRPGQTQSGTVTRLMDGVADPPQTDTPSLTATFDLLKAVFDDLPQWDDWYVDMSHRLRHGCGRIAGITGEDGLLAVAMTTAECESAALIGGVATRPDQRGRGYARRCVSALAAALQQEGKAVWLSPKNDYAKALYRHWGFVPVGEWAQIKWKD